MTNSPKSQECFKQCTDHSKSWWVNANTTKTHKWVVMVTCTPIRWNQAEMFILIMTMCCDSWNAYIHSFGVYEDEYVQYTFQYGVYMRTKELEKNYMWCKIYILAGWLTDLTHMHVLWYVKTYMYVSSVNTSPQNAGNRFVTHLLQQRIIQNPKTINPSQHNHQETTCLSVLLYYTQCDGRAWKIQ